MVLDSTWFANSPLDFEHKKWLLLAYTQNIHKNFVDKIIFPYLNDIKYHLSNLDKWQTTREVIIKKELRGIDWENLTLLYDIPECSPEMEELQKIIDWSYPRLQKMERIGRILWTEIENKIDVKYYGIWINQNIEGNLLIETPILTHEYKYKISPIISPEQVIFNKIDCYLTKTVNKVNFKNGWWVKAPEASVEGTLEPIIKRNLLNWINNK